MACSEAWRWQAHVVSQVRSGLSQAVYCRIYGIPLAEFARWRRWFWQRQLRPLRLIELQRRDG